jgi:hypothetical protein
MSVGAIRKEIKMIVLPKEITIGESYDPAMKITDPQEASKYFEALVQRDITHFGTSRQEAERVERINLGYYAGYYDSATRERVERLFNCAHPYFGKVSENGTPSTDDAISMGRKLAAG